MLLTVGLFTVIYLATTFILVPSIASFFGRVPLPFFETKSLRPLNRVTCLLNRHYVRPALRETLLSASEEFHKKYPGSVVNYLDANFPFIDQFPLFPHLSHHDGKKIDLAFAYRDTRTGDITHLHPSFTGYGICEEPLANEYNMPENCKRKGFWQYNFLKLITPQNSKKNFAFDAMRTKTLIQELTEHDAVEKIFIEPHLRVRLGLTSAKIRFHGCQAVRHDDHIHVQID